VEDMASRAGMSPRTFARVFVAETGDTPALYLEKLRLEHAVRLLETTGTSLDMTAQSCGFTFLLPTSVMYAPLDSSLLSDPQVVSILSTG